MRKLGKKPSFIWESNYNLLEKDGVLMAEVQWVDPQTGKVWYRRGECTFCGGCCTTLCPHLKFTVLRDFHFDEGFYGVGKDKGNIIAVCDIFNEDVTVDAGCVRGCTLKVRKEFPSSPLNTVCGCAFYWVDEEGKKWTQENHDYRYGVLER